MKKVVKNKQVLLGLLVLVIVVAGAVNWATKGIQEEPAVPVSVPLVSDDAVPESDDYKVTEEDYFANMKMERDAGRGKELEINNDVVNNPNSGQEAKKDAQNEVKRIALAIENEVAIESLVRAKGFENVYALIGKDSVNIIVKADGLLPAQVAQIKDIAIEKTGFKANMVKIVEAK